MTLTFWVADAADLAAYELVVPVDPAEVELLTDTELSAVGQVFAYNPAGQYRRSEHRDGQLAVVSARRGQTRTATGAATLATVQLRLGVDGFPASLAGTRVRLLASDYSARDLVLDGVASQVAAPRDFALGANFPNPFNPSTTIPFRIPAVAGMQPMPVRLEIFNSLGQRVRFLVDEARVPGHYRATWDGRDDAGRAIASGVYLYRLRAGEAIDAGKMVLLE